MLPPAPPRIPASPMRRCATASRDPVGSPPIPARLVRAGSLLHDEPPLRSELFNADQMEQHGKRLAATHRLAAGRHPVRLLSRLDENAGILQDVCALLTAAV